MPYQRACANVRCLSCPKACTVPKVDEIDKKRFHSERCVSSPMPVDWSQRYSRFGTSFAALHTKQVIWIRCWIKTEWISNINHLIIEQILDCIELPITGHKQRKQLARPLQVFHVLANSLFGDEKHSTARMNGRSFSAFHDAGLPPPSISEKKKQETRLLSPVCKPAYANGPVTLSISHKSSISQHKTRVNKYSKPRYQPPTTRLCVHFD